MAIDTAAKRSSVQGYTLGLTRPPPDGSMTASDRAHAAWLYSGLSYAAPVEAVIRKSRQMLMRIGRMLG